MVADPSISSHNPAPATPTAPAPQTPRSPILVDYIISLLPANPPDPSSPSSPLEPAHQCLPDHTALLRRLSSSNLTPAAQQAAKAEADRVAGMIAAAVNEEERKQLKYGLDSRTDSGFCRVLQAAQRVRDAVNGQEQDQQVGQGEQGGAAKRKEKGQGQGAGRVVVQSFRFIDGR